MPALAACNMPMRINVLPPSQPAISNTGTSTIAYCASTVASHKEPVDGDSGALSIKNRA